MHAESKTKMYSNISKSEFASLQSIARARRFYCSKKSRLTGTVVVINKCDYIAEVERNYSNYYEKLQSDPSEEVKSRISDCMKKLSDQRSSICDKFDILPSEIRTPQFYILPKTHEEFDDNLPLGYPGRPIVSACNSCTE